MFEELIWGVPLAVVSLGLVRPSWGLMALAGSLPLFGAPPGGPYLAALDVSALCAIVLSWRGEGRAPEPPRLRWPILALVLVSFVSLAPFSYAPPSFQPSLLLGLVSHLPDVPPWTTLYGLRALLDLLLATGIYFAVRRVFGSSPEPLGMAVAGGLGFVLVLGLAEHAGILGLDAYRSIDETLHATRLHSLFFHSGWLAEYVVLATPFAAACLLGATPAKRIVGVLLVILAVATLVFTQQRGAWFAAIAQIATLAVVTAREVVRDRKRLRSVLLVALGAAGAASLVIALNPDTASPILARVRVAASDLSGRTHLWSAGGELFEERPVLGWGLGGFAAAYDELRPRGSPDAWHFRDTAHSTYVNVAVERGILGLAALALLAVALLPGLFRAAMSRASRHSVLATGLLASAAGAAVHGMVQDLFYLRCIQWLGFILLAAAAPFATGAGAAVSRKAAMALGAAAFLALPWRLFALDPVSIAGNRSFGFHEVENSAAGRLEWTTGRAARRLPWKGKTLVVPLANGHPRADRHPVGAILRVDGREIAATHVPGGWTEYRLMLGPPTRDWIVLELEVEPTFRPFSEFQRFELPHVHDFRSLGVAVGEIRWE